jgi:hypothetical protein
VLYTAVLMQDGSCQAVVQVLGGDFLGITTTPRSDVAAGTCPAIRQINAASSWVYTLQDGYLKAEVISASPISLYSLGAVGDVCTGFNLEAFDG